MKHINLKVLPFLTFSVVAAWSLPVLAADTIQAPWNEVCKVADGHELILTTADGQTVEGYCVSVKVDEISVNTKDQKVVRVARTALSRMQVNRSKKRRQLSSLGKGMRAGFRQGFDWLFSPLAPLGAVVVPGTLAWGIVAAPFCLLSDLNDEASGTQDIQVI